MASITAVELGADTCAFARTSVHRGEVRLSAAEILDPAAFPGVEAFTMAVRQTRRSMRLPRRCRAVVWGLPEGANRRDATVQPLIEPLTAAGFKVERVVSPCNALAALARLKTSRGEGSTCWLAINRGGVAIVVVRPGKQLYAHSFAWDSSVGATGSQARLLQRYSLVSFLAPEVKRAMAEARNFGTPVDVVVICGNLPDLRSLTMPLIEELDVEVETLDSLEGLVVNPQSVEKLAEAAPAIRLACAAAVARGSRVWDESKRRSPSGGARAYIRAAAAAAAVAGLGYLWYTRGPWTKPAPAPAVVRVPAAAPKPNPPAVSAPATAPKSNPPAVSVSASAAKSTTPPARVPPPAVSVPATTQKSNPPAVTVPPPAPKPTPPAASAPSAAKSTAPPARVPPPAVSAPVAAPKSNPPTATVPAKPNAAAPKTSAPAIPWKPAVVTPPPPAPAKRAEPNPPARPPVARPPAPVVNATNTVPRSPLQPLVTMPSPNTPAPSAPGRSAAAPAARVPPPPVTAPPPAPRPNPPVVSAPPPAARPNPAALNPPLLPADKPEAGGAARTPSGVVPAASVAQRGPVPPLLKDAVPRVTAILVSRDRRFATIDGGQIIGIGDLLGRRTVVGMDERSVVLQEPSGVQIRIGLGGRLLGIERAAR